jgi:orotidine 5'-phosphate decarboxylase subfamily 2
MKFYQRIRRIQKRNDSLLCIGLDPDPAKMPVHLRKTRDPLYEFSRRIVDATCDLVCAYKINLAFFEASGVRGLKSLERVVASIPRDVLKIGDGKRGDIGNSAERYSESLFREFGFDAVTVNPYMGTDSVAPFLRDPARGAFILALTSNSGAKDFQYLTSRGRPLYEHVIARTTAWNSRKNCGIVVGATRPGELRRIRAMSADMPFLIPGVGAQGGDIGASVRYGCTSDGSMAIINAGRSILYASSSRDFPQASRTATLRLLDTIRGYREKYFSR